MQPPNSLLNLYNAVTTTALRRLLRNILSQRPDVCFRFRLLGETWTPNFHRIIQVWEKGVLLRNEATRHLTGINDVANIMQFEINNTFGEYESSFEYFVSFDGLAS